MNEKMKNDELSIEQILSSIRSSISNSDLSGDESNNNPDVIELTNIVDDDGNIKFYDKKQESTDLSANDSSALNLILKNSLSVSALNDIEKLASRGICLAGKITSLCSDKISTQIARIKSLSGEIELLDERINQVGLIHPEIKPITDMFTKRKENFQGNDPIQLSQETRKCYQMLHEEGESLGGLLASVSKELKAAHVDTFHAAVSSISVEVPGR